MPESNSDSELEMVVVGLVLDPVSNAPIVILKEPAGERCLPIWIALGEANSIANGLRRIEVVRPMTHDLIQNLIQELNVRVARVSITELRENTFFASLELVVGEAVHQIDSRPSDAIALAVRVGAPIYVSTKVLEQAQVTLVGIDQIQDLVASGGEYRGGEEIPIMVDGESSNVEFIGVERDQWAEILAEMDPDDFKYKM